MASPQTVELDDDRLLRYSSQVLLPAIGIEGQERLLRSHVLQVGIGGLGSPIAMYLAACGVGRMTLVDPDHVELVNLQRQILYRTSQVGSTKAAAAQENLRELNPDPRIGCIEHKADLAFLREHVRDVDLVIDATDNYPIRSAINQACVEASVPWVFGAVIRMEGQVAVFRNHSPEDACYHCLFGSSPGPEEGCAQTGILGPVAGVIASVQAVEAVKILLGAGAPLYNRLLLYDAAQAAWRDIALQRDPQCPVCARN